MSSGAVAEVLARWRAACDEVAVLPLDALSASERLAVLDELERARRRQPAVEHRLIAGLRAQCTPAELGAANWAEVLRLRLRISATEAKRRLTDAEALGPRTALTGEVLEPLWPNVADRQAAGQIGAEQLAIIRNFFHDLTAAVDYQTRQGCEETLATLAARHTPEELRKLATRLAALVHPDGEYSDTDHARQRYLRFGPQQADGTSELHGRVDAELRALLDAVFAKRGAPGMGNPDDDSPCLAGEPDNEAVRRDTRTPGQRNHDALKAMAYADLASGHLGQHNGLPTTVIVSTTLQELQSGAGQAVTGGGTLLPMRDLIRLASHAYHYLAVFDQHTNEPLYLGRTKRLASTGQRIVLHARDRGCTKPGCTIPGYWCQVHHLDGWADNGPTDITRLTLACGPHNRLIEKSGWTTTTRKDGRTQWIPPPHLDWGHHPLAGDGQARVNNYHHPQDYFTHDEDDP